jgi:hypothetical protein
MRGSVVALAMLVAGAATAQNLVTNAGFDGGVSGWQLTQGETDTQIAHRADVGSTLSGGSGPGSLQVEMSFWNGSLGGCYQQVTVNGGVEYRAEASLMLPTDIDNTANDAQMRIEWWDGDGWVIDSDWIGVYPLDADTWARASDSVVAPADAVTARVWLMVGTPALDNETVPGIALFDDVVLLEVGATQAQQVLFVPAAASAAGNNNTHWSTTGWFANQVGFPVQLAAALLPPGQDNTAALASLTSIGTVPAGGFLEVTDLVAAVGESGKTGGLYIVATADAAGLPATLVHATTTTFTPNPNGAGVYGQGLPAVPPGIANEVVLPGVFQGSARRTNVGVLNTSSATLEVTLQVTASDGQIIGTTDWTLLPYGQRQTSVTNLGASSINGGAITVTRTSTGGSFRAYLSVVDQSSGDAIYTAGM